MAVSRRTDIAIICGLIALSAIPAIAGTARLVQLGSGAPATADTLRFVTAPLPVTLHIIGATLYTLLGAFQFSPGLRRAFPLWHRRAGQVLAVAGGVAALSGLWMAMTYAIIPADHWLLHAFRLLAGSAMLGALGLGLLAIRARDVARHRHWMLRAYAIGQGAGTQAITQLPIVLIFGPPDDLTRALLMGAGWAINLVVAEWLIRRRPARPGALPRPASAA